MPPECIYDYVEAAVDSNDRSFASASSKLCQQKWIIYQLSVSEMPT